jgi:hypothetical protein
MMIHSNLMMADAIMEEAQRRAAREQLIHAVKGQDGGRTRGTGILSRLGRLWGSRTVAESSPQPGGRLQTQP